MGEEHRQQMHDILGPDFADAINKIPDFIFDGITDGESIKIYTDAYDETASRSCTLVVTDAALYVFRLGTFNKKFLGKETIRFGSIKGIELEKETWSQAIKDMDWKVVINRSGDFDKIGHLNQATAQEIVDVVQQGMDVAHGVKAAPAAAPAADPMEKIQKLKEMLEAGLINEEEFDAKKAAIIESM